MLLISGAGPSVIAFATKSSNLKKISLSMSKGFAAANRKCETVICRPSKGAKVIKNWFAKIIDVVIFEKSCSNF